MTFIEPEHPAAPQLLRIMIAAVLMSACAGHTPLSSTRDHPSVQATTQPNHLDWMKTEYAALWAQGGRGIPDTPATEAEALGHVFVVAGYADDSDYGPTIRRATALAVCDGQARWPPEAADRWVVATGRLAPFSGCGDQVLDLRDCPHYTLLDCTYFLGVRPEDVEPEDYDVLAGPWRASGLEIGSTTTITGRVGKDFGAGRTLVEQDTDRLFLLTRCRFEAAFPPDTVVSVRGRVAYLPPVVPPAIALTASSNSAAYIQIEDCIVSATAPRE